MRDFGVEFLWGAATSAHQVEGANTNNDWWVWEHEIGTYAAASSGDGIDHYARYDDDFALLASLGHNAHRFSLEWSRIEPAPGAFSNATLDHYGRVLDSLHHHSITPVVTLYHKTLPRWFADRGGWTSRDALERFGRFAEVVGGRLGGSIAYACTVNEPQILPLFGYTVGRFPPAKTDRGLAEEVNTVLIAAHRVAVDALRAGDGAPRIGTCLQLVPMEPLDPEDLDDVTTTAWLRRLMVDSHIDDLRAGGDVGNFVGLQYYTRARIDASSPTLIAPPRAGVETTHMGWEVYAPGFGQMLRRIADAGLPVLVTENGIATNDDHQRVRYIASHLDEMRRAMHDGVDVRGYLHWSAFDNFEWNHGFAPTFGLVGIDRADGFRRVVRKSARAFEHVARTGEVASLRADDGVCERSR